MQTASTHTLADLLAVLGTATEEEIRAYFHGVDDLVAVEWGKQVATQRIRTDAPHIIGDAHVVLKGASEAQKQWLGAINTDTLRLAAGAVALAVDLHERRSQALKASKTEQGEVAGLSDQKKSSAVAQRDVLHGILEKISAGVEPYASRIAGAYSKAELPIVVAESTERLVAIGRELLRDRNPGVVARRKTTRLSGAWLDEIEARAPELRKLGEKAAAVRTAPPVSASEVDLRDGWALMLLDEIVTAFDRAHDADPTIPRINVYSLRRALRTPRVRKSPDEPVSPIRTNE